MHGSKAMYKLEVSARALSNKANMPLAIRMLIDGFHLGQSDESSVTTV